MLCNMLFASCHTTQGDNLSEEIIAQIMTKIEEEDHRFCHGLYDSCYNCMFCKATLFTIHI